MSPDPLETFEIDPEAPGLQIWDSEKWIDVLESSAVVATVRNAPGLKIRGVLALLDDPGPNRWHFYSIDNVPPIRWPNDPRGGP